MTTIGAIFDIPTQVHQGDFVLRLTKGVTRPADTLRTYVVTPQLVGCFDQALDLIRSALESNTSKGAYLHGSFGSGCVCPRHSPRGRETRCAGPERATAG
jgi:hypothetical protein